MMRPEIFIDADACPVKDEIYKVAFRYDLVVHVVANQPIRAPKHERIHRIVVNDKMDAADDWIADHAHAASIVITADIPLAERCLKSSAIVIGPNGKPFTNDNIGAAIAQRAIMADLRVGADGIGGGPPPFQKSDRSRFLSTLDEAVNRSMRSNTE